MKKPTLAFLVVSLLLALAACSGDAGDESNALGREAYPDVTGVGRSRLAEIGSWGYQLQNIDIDTLSQAGYDVLVIDAADNDGIPWTPGQIEQLKAGGQTRVLAYVSIGEAENYRDYWDDGWLLDSEDPCRSPLSDTAPGWLEPVNPEWCGNYPVRYWDPAWGSILDETLSRLVETGYDGVYLDKVDSYYYWLGEEYTGASEVIPWAGIEMAALVGRLAELARATNPDFAIVPQNGVEIVETLDDDGVTSYLSMIDAVAVEDTFFVPRGGREAGDNAAYRPNEYTLYLLGLYVQAGLPVLAVDYVTDPGKIEQFEEDARGYGFIPLAATRELDRAP